MQPRCKSNAVNHSSKPKIEKDSRSPSFGRGFTATLLRIHRVQRVVPFLFLVLKAGRVSWFLDRSFPQDLKNRSGRYHAPPSQRCAVSASVNFLSRGKTLNVVDVFVPRLSVVVMFHDRTFTRLAVFCRSSNSFHRNQTRPQSHFLHSPA